MGGPRERHRRLACRCHSLACNYAVAGATVAAADEGRACKARESRRWSAGYRARASSFTDFLSDSTKMITTSASMTSVRTAFMFPWKLCFGR
jgi:hypothetical protein